MKGLLKAPQQSDIQLHLEAEDFWRFGQTGAPLLSTEKAPDAVPLSEVRIQWNSYTTAESALFSVRQIVIPASGVKGALAQRLAFHYRCLTDDFSQPSEEERELEQKTTRDQDHPLANLLGYAADTEHDENLGQAGLLFFRDVYLTHHDDDLSHIMHTSIDRFTGGVREGALFMEEMVWEKTFQLEIDIDWSRLQQQEKDNPQHYKTLFHALHLTLNDLCDGQLALGAGSSKGYGYFTGNTQYSATLQSRMET